MVLIEQYGTQGIINLACIFWLLFTAFAENSIIAPTFAPYMKYLGDTDLQIYTIAVPMVYVSAAMTMFYIATRKDPNIRIIAIVTGLSGLVGSLIYIFPWSPWSILLARLLCGVSYGDSIMKLVYIHKYIPLQCQKETMTYMYLDTLFGYAFGFAASAFTEVHFPEKGAINKLNGGVLMLCPFLLIQVLSFTFFYVKPNVQHEPPVSDQENDRYSKTLFGIIIFLNCYLYIIAHASGDQTASQVFDYFGYPYFFVWYYQIYGFILICLGIYFNPQSRSLTTTMICVSLCAFTLSNIISLFTHNNFLVYIIGVSIGLPFFGLVEINLETKFLEIISEVSNPNIYIMMKELIKTIATAVGLLITGEMYDNKEGFSMYVGLLFFQTCPAIIAAAILLYNENRMTIINHDKDIAV